MLLSRVCYSCLIAMLMLLSPVQCSSSKEDSKDTYQGRHDDEKIAPDNKERPAHIGHKTDDKHAVEIFLNRAKSYKTMDVRKFLDRSLSDQKIIASNMLKFDHFNLSEQDYVEIFEDIYEQEIDLVPQLVGATLDSINYLKYSNPVLVETVINVLMSFDARSALESAELIKFDCTQAEENRFFPIFFNHLSKMSKSDLVLLTQSTMLFCDDLTEKELAFYFKVFKIFSKCQAKGQNIELMIDTAKAIIDQHPYIIKQGFLEAFIHIPEQDFAAVCNVVKEFYLELGLENYSFEACNAKYHKDIFNIFGSAPKNMHEKIKNYLVSEEIGICDFDEKLTIIKKISHEHMPVLFNIEKLNKELNTLDHTKISPDNYLVAFLSSLSVDVLNKLCQELGEASESNIRRALILHGFCASNSNFPPREVNNYLNIFFYALNKGNVSKDVFNQSLPDPFYIDLMDTVFSLSGDSVDTFHLLMYSLIWPVNLELFKLEDHYISHKDNLKMLAESLKLLSAEQLLQFRKRIIICGINRIEALPAGLFGFFRLCSTVSSEKCSLIASLADSSLRYSKVDNRDPIMRSRIYENILSSVVEMAQKNSAEKLSQMMVILNKMSARRYENHPFFKKHQVLGLVDDVYNFFKEIDLDYNQESVNAILLKVIETGMTFDDAEKRTQAFAAAADFLKQIKSVQSHDQFIQHNTYEGVIREFAKVPNEKRARIVQLAADFIKNLAGIKYDTPDFTTAVPLELNHVLDLLNDMTADQMAELFRAAIECRGPGVSNPKEIVTLCRMIKSSQQTPAECIIIFNKLKALEPSWDFKSLLGGFYSHVVGPSEEMYQEAFLNFFNMMAARGELETNQKLAILRCLSSLPQNQWSLFFENQRLIYTGQSNEVAGLEKDKLLIHHVKFITQTGGAAQEQLFQYWTKVINGNNQILADSVSAFIMNCYRVFGIDEDHELVQHAIRVRALLNRNNPKNPYVIFEGLKAKKMIPLDWERIEPVLGTFVIGSFKLNCQNLARLGASLVMDLSSVPIFEAAQYAKMLNDLKVHLQENNALLKEAAYMIHPTIPRNKDETDNDFIQRMDVEFIKLIDDHLLPNSHMNLLLKASSESIESAKLKCVLAHFSDMSPIEFKNKELCRFVAMVRHCAIGQNRSIQGYYVRLPSDKRIKTSAGYLDVSSAQLPALQSLCAAIQHITILQISENGQFLRDICGVERGKDVEQSSHQELYIKSGISEHIGGTKDLKWDPNFNTVYAKLLSMPIQEMVQTFYKHLDLKLFVQKVQKQMNEQIQAQTLDEKRMLYSALSQIHSMPPQNDEFMSWVDLDEDTFTVLDKVTENGVVRTMQKTGLLDPWEERQ